MSKTTKYHIIIQEHPDTLSKEVNSFLEEQSFLFNQFNVDNITTIFDGRKYVIAITYSGITIPGVQHKKFL